MLTALALAATIANAPAAAGQAGCAYTAGAATLPVGGRPFAAEPSKDGCWIFVSLSGEAGGRGGIAVLRNAGGRFTRVRTIDVDKGCEGLTLSHDGARLLVASGDLVRVFDVAKLEYGGAAEVGQIPDGAGSKTIYLALSADDRLLFASDEAAGRITVSDFARGQREGFGSKLVIGRIPQGAAPVGLALSPDGSRLYATSERAAPSRTFPTRCRAEQRNTDRDHPEGALSVIDVAKAATDPAHALLTALSAGCNPVRVTLAGDGATAWVTARGENAVYAIPVADLTASTHVTRTRYTVGDSPVGVIAQPGSDLIWISNSNRFSETKADVQSLSPVNGASTHIATGRFPRDLRFLPDGRTLVVAVFGAEAVQFIPTPTGGLDTAAGG